MEAGYRYGTVVAQPHQHSTAARIRARMISAGHSIAFPAARHNEKGLERPSFQQFTDITNHKSHSNQLGTVRQSYLTILLHGQLSIRPVLVFGLIRAIRVISFGCGSGALGSSVVPICMDWALGTSTSSPGPLSLHLTVPGLSATSETTSRYPARDGFCSARFYRSREWERTLLCVPH
jgi:hypothetical protein